MKFTIKNDKIAKFIFIPLLLFFGIVFFHDFDIKNYINIFQLIIYLFVAFFLILTLFSNNKANLVGIFFIFIGTMFSIPLLIAYFGNPEEFGVLIGAFFGLIFVFVGVLNLLRNNEKIKRLGQELLFLVVGFFMILIGIFENFNLWCLGFGIFFIISITMKIIKKIKNQDEIE